MNIIKSKIGISVLASSILFSCSYSPNNTTVNSSSDNKNGQIKVNIFNPAKLESNFGKFRVKEIDATDVYSANLFVTGPGIQNQINNAVSNPIRLPNGQASSAIYLNSIPTGKNRIIKVNALDRISNSMGNHVAIMGVTNVNSTYADETEVSWKTTPTAKVIERLITLNSSYANTIDYKLIQATVDKIIDNTTTGNLTDDIHPSLVNANSIGNYINSNSGNLPTVTTTTQAGTYRMATQTISGRINGITYSVVGVGQTLVKHKAPAKVICNDPASSPAIVTDVDGNYTITGVTPGTGYTVKALTDYYDSASLTNISSGATNVNFSPNKQHYLEFSINSAYGAFRFTTARAIKVQVIVPNASRASQISYAQKHRDSITKSINAWANLASDKISFSVLPDIFDNDPNLAAKKAASDIYIEWAGFLGGNQLGVTYSAPNTNNTAVPPGSTQFPINFNVMPYYNNYKASVSLTIKDGSGQDVPDFMLSAVATHEIGHALGLAISDSLNTGNSHPQTNGDDLMAPILNSTTPTNLNISLRDLNTLRFLYEIPANLTNN